MFSYLDSENKELHIQCEKIVYFWAEKNTWIKKAWKHWKAWTAEKVHSASKAKAKEKEEHHKKEKAEYT